VNQSITQFWVAIIGLVGLIAVTLTAVLCQAFGESPGELTFMLVGGLISVTATASAWLFRITNGAAQKAKEPPA
jgi:hypothetical protein